MGTPKTPIKDSATKRLEAEQLNTLNKQKIDASAAIKLRKKKIKNNSLGRRSLLRTSEKGITPKVAES